MSWDITESDLSVRLLDCLLAGMSVSLQFICLSAGVIACMSSCSLAFLAAGVAGMLAYRSIYNLATHILFLNSRLI